MDGLHSLNSNSDLCPIESVLSGVYLAEDERQMDHPQDFHLFFQCGAVVYFPRERSDDHDDRERRGCAFR